MVFRPVLLQCLSITLQFFKSLHYPRRKFTTGAAPRQHCQRTSSAGIVLAVDPHEVCHHGVPTLMYYKGVLTDGGEANEFISATSRGRSRN